LLLLLLLLLEYRIAEFLGRPKIPQFFNRHINPCTWNTTT